MKARLIGLVFLFFIAISISAVRATVTTIDSCQSLALPGETYVLNQSITNSPTTWCLSLAADNITLDCQGNTLSGDGTATKAIVIGSNYNTVKNCIIKNYANAGDTSMYLAAVSGNNIYNDTFMDNDGNGLVLTFGDSNNVVNDTFINNSFLGIYNFGSNSNTFANITLINNSRGIDFDYSTYEGVVTGVTATGNTYAVYIDYWSNRISLNDSILTGNQYGVYIDRNASQNTIYNNFFNNMVNYYNNAGTSNYLNTTKQNGTRIYSSGTEIGGNYWTNPTGNGFSDTCTDADNDGFCDKNYTLDSSDIDFLPIAKTVGQIPTTLPTINISSCANLDQEGATYLLNASIIDSTNTICMTFSNDNITLDCQGNTIDGVGSSSTYGIYSTYQNDTIKNCIVTDWEVGIHMDSGSDYASIFNTTAESNRVGILIRGVSNTADNVSVISNRDNGFYIAIGSDHNVLNNIVSNSNGYIGGYIYSGVWINGGNDNTISNIVADNNYFAGILFYGGDDNTIINSELNNNQYGFEIVYTSGNCWDTCGMDAGCCSMHEGCSYAGFGCTGTFSSRNSITRAVIKNSSQEGIAIGAGSTGISINDSIIQDSGIDGVGFHTISGNRLYNCLLNNTWNLYNENEGYNTLNTSKQSGTRIYSTGNEIGGNYWTNSNGNGYSDTCIDADGDGFCDRPYTLADNSIDYLPLSNQYAPYNTPIGINITVNISNVLINFSQVTSPGNTFVNTSTTNPGPEKPNFKFLKTYYNISTTATYIGPVEICLTYNDSDISGNKEKNLKIFHWNSTDYVDVTYYLNITTNVICGNVSSLSWFTVGYELYVYSSILPPINADGSSIFKLGSTVPVKFQLWNVEGNFVRDAVARIYVAKISDNIIGTEMEAESTSAATTGNLFRYDSIDNQYIFNLGTKDLSTGTWQIRIELDDGTSKYVNISLK